MKNDSFYMKRALELASEAEGNTSPNPMVGCVITDIDGNIVGEGYHKKAGEAHAEVNALADMRKNGKQGHTAYVSLEPCSHYGRTGPCCDALIAAGLKRVVAAMTDPNPKVAGRGLKKMQDAGIEVTSGVCEEEAENLNEKFLTYITKKRPFISLKYAMTLDGKLTTCARDSHYVTGAEAHKYSHNLRRTHDAILVGIKTIEDDDAELTTRLVEGKNPLRIVLDSSCRISPSAKVLNGEAETLICVGPDADAERKKIIAAKEKVELLELPYAENRNISKGDIDVNSGKKVLDLHFLINKLHEREISSLLVEGGSEVLGSFVDEGFGDRVYAFIAPKIVGGRTALPAIGGEGIAVMNECAGVEDMEFVPLGKDLLLTGRIVYKNSL